MGKAVPKGIKSKAAILLESFPESFSDSFEQNKKAINEVNFPLSKKERNAMAGFIVRKKKAPKTA